MSIVLDGDNGITTPSYGGTDTSEYLVPVTGFKNRLINGAMQIDQRNAGASVTVTSSAPYTLDRWQGYSSTTGKFTAQQNAGSVTPPAGFTNYLGCTSTSAYSITSTDQMIMQQQIEGFNVADLGFGTANASTITLSFWVRSSLTGTFGGALQNSAQNRCYPFSFTISSANTWEYKTITVAGDTTGTWLTTNGKGLNVIFSLGTGATYSGTAGAWTSSSSITSATGATSVVGTNGATFQITGLQLEKGSTATSFDYRPYGQELALCQRYWTALGMAATTDKFPSTAGTICNFAVAAQNTYTLIGVRYPVQMRASPTVVFANVDGTLGLVRNAATGATYSVTSYETNSIQMAAVTATGVTAGMYIQNQFSASAEL